MLKPAVVVPLLAAAACGQYLEKTIPLPSGSRAWGVCYSRTSDKLYCVNWGTGDLCIVDGIGDTIIATLPTIAQASWPVWNSVSNTVYVGLQTGVLVVDCAGNQVVTTIPAGSHPVGILHNPLTNRGYCANELSSNLTVWDGASNAVIATVPVGYSCYIMALAGRDNRVFCTNWTQSTVSVVDGTSNQVLATLSTGQFPVGICYNSGHNKVYTANMGDNTVTVIDAASLQVLRTLNVDGSPEDVCYNPENNKVYCLNGEDNTVLVFDGEADTFIRRVAVGASPRYLLHDSAGNKVYCVNETSNDVTVIDGRTDAVLTTVAVGAFPTDLAADPGRRRVYVTCYDGHSIAVLRDSSTVGAAESAAAAATGLRVWPNPCAAGRVNLDCGAAGPGTVRVLDVAGRTVLSAHAPAGSGPTGIDVSGLAAGVYLLRIEQPGRSSARKLVLNQAQN